MQNAKVTYLNKVLLKIIWYENSNKSRIVLFNFVTTLCMEICLEPYLILKAQVISKDHLASMNRCFLVIYCFDLCAGIIIHAQYITQSDSGLTAVGILGSLGISGIKWVLICSIDIQRNMERSSIKFANRSKNYSEK